MGRNRQRSGPAALPGSGQGAGLTIWRSREQLTRSRRHTRIVITCLAVLAALWTAGLSGGVGDDALLGFVILEVFTLSPLVYAAFRSHHLTREIREADRRGVAGQQPVPADPAEQSRGDQLLARIGQMVGTLGPGALRDAGDDAVRQARDIVAVRAQLAQRLDQLTGMESLLDDRDAAGTVQGSADATLQHLASVDRALDELAASVARLVDSSGAGQIQDELDEVRGATDRVAALSGAMDELRAGEPDLGTQGPATAPLPGSASNADQR